MRFLQFLYRKIVSIFECYEKGSVVLSFDKSFQPRIEWENPDLNIHWMTPVLKGDLLYGISGRHQETSLLRESFERKSTVERAGDLER